MNLCFSTTQWTFLFEAAAYETYSKVRKTVSHRGTYFYETRLKKKLTITCGTRFSHKTHTIHFRIFYHRLLEIKLQVDKFTHAFGRWTRSRSGRVLSVEVWPGPVPELNHWGCSHLFYFVRSIDLVITVSITAISRVKRYVKNMIARFSIAFYLLWGYLALSSTPVELGLGLANCCSGADIGDFMTNGMGGQPTQPPPPNVAHDQIYSTL